MVPQIVLSASIWCNNCKFRKSSQKPRPAQKMLRFMNRRYPTCSQGTHQLCTSRTYPLRVKVPHRWAPGTTAEWTIAPCSWCHHFGTPTSTRELRTETRTLREDRSFPQETNNRSHLGKPTKSTSFQIRHSTGTKTRHLSTPTVNAFDSSWSSRTTCEVRTLLPPHPPPSTTTVRRVIDTISK